MHNRNSIPGPEGLYDPAHDHDACGVGFVVDVAGKRSHEIVLKALQVLDNLTHRGACGCDPRTGDGAGILVQMPHEFFRREARKCGFELPEPGAYGVGQVFLPLDPERRMACETRFEQIVQEEGQRVLGWRTVPVVESECGEIARRGIPTIRQVFVARGADISDLEALERKLYVIRKRAFNAVDSLGLYAPELFYFCSLSALTVVYKGQLISHQIPRFFPELLDPEFASALAMVHQRFSTNTFPSWDRAHPYRFLSHNGEINTLRGNENWMHARQMMFESQLFGDDIKKLLPIIEPTLADSGKFDNCLELLVRTGRSLPHAVMMMIPEAWQNDAQMSPAKRDFYEFHSCMMEPWDGPASIAFTDGIRIGAVLDRNGLRPSRYTVTKDGLVVMASETGVLDIPPEQIAYKGRLQPGKMFLVDTSLGRIVGDEEIKQGFAARQPYRQWIDENLVKLEALPAPPSAPAVAGFEGWELLKQQQAFGYTIEDLKLILAPMAVNAQEPVGSMGTDTPLAVLSDRCTAGSSACDSRS
jgi:glutamate synthase (ferredoxin)